MDNLSLGKLGERIAASYLAKQGYKIIEMNFKKRWGEIDIVAQEKDILVFVEVKTRIEGDRISPKDSMTFKKINSLKRSLLFYKAKHPELPENLRLDFVGIILNKNLKQAKIDLIRNVSF